MTLEKLKKMLVPGTKYVCTYGDDHVNEYDIDQRGMFGYESGSGYRWLSLDNDEFDINSLRDISVVKEIWNKKDGH